MSQGRFIIVNLRAWPRLFLGVVFLAVAHVEARPPHPDVAAVSILVLVALFFLVSACRVAWLKWRIVLWP
jgi:hypothetical protein